MKTFKNSFTLFIVVSQRRLSNRNYTYMANMKMQNTVQQKFQVLFKILKYFNKNN